VKRTHEMKSRTYSAYGLTVRSEIPLDEFPAAVEEREDVSVVHGATPDWAARFEDRAEAIEIAAGEARFWFANIGAFAVTDGNRITAYPRAGVQDELLRLYVEGMLLAMILHQRGMCVLHASVVEIEGEAVALMGHVGAGKSSLAGALYARGHRVLADDNAAILTSTGHPSVTPAFPYVKLFPAIASSLGFHNGSLRTLHASQPKMAGAVGKGFTTAPSPLSRIYLLSRNHQPEIRQLSPLETTLELIRNAVPTRWGHAGDGRQLHRCGAVGRQVPMFTLRTFTDLGGIPEVARTLEQHSASQIRRPDVVHP
jgi:hypothetical protein